MTVKRLLNKLSKAQQDYYTFLAKECFSGFSNAEDNFNIYRYRNTQVVAIGMVLFAIIITTTAAASIVLKTGLSM